MIARCYLCQSPIRRRRDGSSYATLTGTTADGVTSTYTLHEECAARYDRLTDLRPIREPETACPT